MGSLTYLKYLITDRNIASVAPTSGFGVQKVCRPMDFDSTKAVVEYGPATGVFTKYILERLPPAARFLAVDTNENFLNVLRESIDDPRLHIVHGSAEHVLDFMKEHGIEKADYILSGIPFSFLPSAVADRIVLHTHEALREGGKFLVYQFLRPVGKKTKGIHRYLPRHFATIEKSAELLNIPPLVIYEATKNSALDAVVGRDRRPLE